MMECEKCGRGMIMLQNSITESEKEHIEVYVCKFCNKAIINKTLENF